MNIIEPVFLRNLVVYPIHGDAGNGFTPVTIDDVVDTENGQFRELDTPDVNQIIFENRGDDPVMMLNGDEITGSLQNRIVAASNLVEAHTSAPVPVICVEENRWEEIGGFHTGVISYPRIRSILIQSRHKKIDTQRIIWDEIDRKLTVTKTMSQTSSMHDIYNNVGAEIERYVEGFNGFDHGTIGFIGVAGNRILGCDVFSTPSVYQRFEHKLIKSYALDALEYQHSKGRTVDVDAFFQDVMTRLEGKRLKTTMRTVTMKGDTFFGQALIYDGRPVHCSAFPR
jgi:hypothetical protein